MENIVTISWSQRMKMMLLLKIEKTYAENVLFNHQKEMRVLLSKGAKMNATSSVVHYETWPVAM